MKLNQGIFGFSWVAIGVIALLVFFVGIPLAKSANIWPAQLNFMSLTGAPLAAAVPQTVPPTPGGIQATCEQSTALTASITGYNLDKPSTTVTITNAVYKDSTTGVLNPGGTTLDKNTKYQILSNASGYIKGFVSFTSGCASPLISVQMKGVDTAVSATVYNTNGITENTNDNNLTIGLGGSGTAHVKMSQSANYLHLGGVNNKFRVYVNSSNVTDWSPAEMSATFDNVACDKISGPTPNALTGVKLQEFECTGDFAAQDGGIHDLAVKYQANSGVNPIIQATTISWAAVDYYANTVSGVVETGAVKNDGSAIQALQGVVVRMQ